MELVYLSQDFYNDYAACPEIEKKKYKKAIEDDIEGKKDKEDLVKYSTLQYFHRELKIKDNEKAS